MAKYEVVSPIRTYAGRMKAHLAHIRSIGVSLEMVREELESTGIPFWQGETGDENLQLALLAPIQSPAYRSSLFKAIGAWSAGDPDEAEGDVTLATLITTGRTMRVYGPGKYENRLRSFLQETYCQCQYATQPARCRFCEARDRYARMVGMALLEDDVVGIERQGSQESAS